MSRQDKEYRSSVRHYLEGNQVEKLKTRIADMELAARGVMDAFKSASSRISGRLAESDDFIRELHALEQKRENYTKDDGSWLSDTARVEYETEQRLLWKRCPIDLKQEKPA